MPEIEGTGDYEPPPPAPAPKPAPAPVAEAPPTAPPSGPSGGHEPPPAPSGDTPAKDAPEAEIIAYIKKHYGYMSWALDIPEIKDVLILAHREGYGDDEIRGAITATNWWKTTEPAVRKFLDLASSDPAGLQAQVADTELELQLAAARLGIQIDPNRITNMATDSIKFGWTEAEIRQALLAEFNFDPEVQSQGTIGAGEYNAKALADKYLVPISDQTANDWSQKILSGEATEAGYEAYLKSTAIGMFPALKAYIEQGITPTQYFDPYKERASALLERPLSVNEMFDSKIMGGFQVMDEKKGTMRPLTLNEFEKQVRSTPEWARTDNAKESTAQLVNSISRLFGTT